MSLSPRRREVLNIIANAGEISRSEIAAIMRISPRTAAIYVTDLRNMNLIEPSSFGRFSVWRVVASPSTEPKPKRINVKGISANAPAHPPAPREIMSVFRAWVS